MDRAGEPVGTDAEIEPSYELTLKGQGLEIKRSLPQSVALRVIGLVMGGTAGGAAFPGRVAGSKHHGAALSLSEFIHDRNAKRNPDKILAIAAYLTSHMGRTAFTKEELKSEFQAGGQPLPGNFSRDFAWTVSNRWLAPSHDNPGEFFVTATGAKAVEDGFAGDVKKATRFGRANRKRRGRRQTAN